MRTNTFYCVLFFDTLRISANYTIRNVASVTYMCHKRNREERTKEKSDGEKMLLYTYIRVLCTNGEYLAKKKPSALAIKTNLCLLHAVFIRLNDITFRWILRSSFLYCRFLFLACRFYQRAEYYVVKHLYLYNVRSSVIVNAYALSWSKAIPLLRGNDRETENEKKMYSKRTMAKGAHAFGIALKLQRYCNNFTSFLLFFVRWCLPVTELSLLCISRKYAEWVKSFRLICCSEYHLH